MTTLHAIIFDMDGVLTDSEPLICAAAIEMFREHGLTVLPEDFHPFIGAGENRYLGGVAEKYGAVIDVAAAKKRTYEIYLEMVPQRLRAFDGAVDFVTECRRTGLATAVASSADRIKVEANLIQIGLPPSSWDAIITAEDVIRRKPDPDIFLAAAAKMRVTPDDCLVIEDAINGIRAARAAGMRCLALAQTFSAEQLREADWVFASMSDITLARIGALCCPGELVKDQSANDPGHQATGGAV